MGEGNVGFAGLAAIVVTIITAIGGAVAGTLKLMAMNRDTRESRNNENIWKFIEELQEELTRTRVELSAVREENRQLWTRIRELERKVSE